MKKITKLEEKSKENKKVLYYIIQIMKFIKKCILFSIFQMVYKWKIVITILSIIGIVKINDNKEIFLNVLNNDYVKIFTMYNYHNNIYLPLYIIEVLVFIGLIYTLCTKYKKRDIKHKELEKVKNLRNGKNETPFVIKRIRLWENLKIEKIIMNSNGIDISRLDNNIINDLSATLNREIIDIKNAKNKKNILEISTINPKYRIPDEIEWKNSYLSNIPFELILGESIKGKVKINLDKTPHILIGGTTGCGKTMLLENLIYQAKQKNAIIRVGDLKGLDFDYINNYEDNDFKSAGIRFFDKQCKILTDNESVLKELKIIRNEITERKIKFSNDRCNNINKYNKLYPDYQLSRIIFVIDEVGTLLSGENKDLIKEISYIAMQGRAFGVHLILSTQRPDCNMLDGQIKSNLDVRICGRTPDRSLSEVVLGKGNYNADTMIRKEDRGVFITNNDEIFRGYMFKNENINSIGDNENYNDNK